MASITTWVRLEPRGRDPQLLAGTEARLHDPLWLLARQWQFGELTGADAGSAITARTRFDSARLDAVRTTGSAWHAHDPDRTPLDTVMAPIANEPAAKPPFGRRARTGRQLSRMLAGLPSASGVMLSRFPFRATAGELAVLDEDDRRFAAVMVDRVPDGDVAAATLAPLLAAGDFAADFGIVASERGAASQVCRAWLAWRAGVIRTSPEPSWQAERLSHRFEARVPMRGFDARLVARDHERSTVHWYDVDALEGDPNHATIEASVSTSIPTHIRFRGSPARRYWDLEDAAVNWGAIRSAPGDVARLISVELALAFADHWLQVPLAVPAGSLTNIRSLVVTDTFGVSTLVRSAAALDGPETAWRFCEITHAPKVPSPILFVPPASGAQLTGRTLEAIELARDDVGDVLWAIDRTLRGADDRPREVAVDMPSVPVPEAPTYRLGPDVPASYHPYRARVGTNGLELVRTTVPGSAALADRPDLPSRLSIAAAPSSPAQVRTYYTLARTSDGAYHLVRRRALTTVAPSPAFVLEFDRVLGDQS
jgi:hypothetical protein